MKNRKLLLQISLSTALVFSLLLPAWVGGASATVPRPNDHFIHHLAIDASSLASATALNTPQGNVTPMVAAGDGYIVGLKSDGTVVAVGWNNSGQCDVGGWTSITQVAAGCLHTVELRTDGTVVAAEAEGRGGIQRPWAVRCRWLERHRPGHRRLQLHGWG
jgi:hypothetical protein